MFLPEGSHAMKVGPMVMSSRNGRPDCDRSASSPFLISFVVLQTFQIHRAVDAGKNVLVDTVVSTKLINGSPFNSIRVAGRTEQQRQSG
jgi:catabolite regulation protein CreA